MAFEVLRELFGLRDLVDILTVSVFIYGIIYFLVVTKGFQILRALIFIGVFWVVAELIQLRTLSWIFEKLWTLGLFSIVVVFQPEIRRALARIGERTKVIKLASLEERTMERIVRACRFMSDRQIGALIVIERHHSVEDVIEGCVYLDATVSVELIITIFYPTTPLHDGAVIVRGDRIAFASCVLPLSKTAKLPKKYGTRHRAALGISEETDAIAVVVSEETGEISLAVGGNLERNLDPEMLRDRLEQLMGLRRDEAS
ncbi:MAG TPA: TIGR00159 family protein [Aquifex aeolicus]|uniref:Diadenylate cyclase n=1 Tax=Aquifex aeolicus TaxID=63363 RepID=A0A7C5L2X8_AQUAO|nr:TIGR00159 family protein [Aquifex aeolicus]